MNDFEFTYQLERRAAGLDYASKAHVFAHDWVPPDRTDIRATWVKHWPIQSRDEVFERMLKKLKTGDSLPRGPLLVTHKSTRKQNASHH